jgi:hypothetical protein
LECSTVPFSLSCPNWFASRDDSSCRTVSRGPSVAVRFLTRLDYLDYLGHNGIGFTHDRRSRKANHRIPVGSENVVAEVVANRLGPVVSSVYFDNRVCLRKKEVHDVAEDLFLPPEHQ